jgi:hypothetical protein
MRNMSTITRSVLFFNNRTEFMRQEGEFLGIMRNV